MTDFNSFVVVGRLGRDATIKETKNNSSYVEFSLASDLGDFGPNVIWFNCKVYRTVGKAIDYLKKGKQVTLSGILSINTKDGKPFYNIKVTDFNFMNSSKDSSIEESTSVKSSEISDDEIPF